MHRPPGAIGRARKLAITNINSPSARRRNAGRTLNQEEQMLTSSRPRFTTIIAGMALSALVSVPAVTAGAPLAVAVPARPPATNAIGQDGPSTTAWEPDGAWTDRVSVNDVRNFRVGIQLIDGGGFSGIGVERFTNFATFGSSMSSFAGDSDNFDPDGARINLNLANVGMLGLVDFRIGGQALDQGNLGVPVFTPWASEGGGTSGLITDHDAFDPDRYRLFLETRPLPAGIQINDIRLYIVAVDQGVEGIPAFTRWASQGGGQSPFALDSDSFDPDGFDIGIEVQ